MYYDDYSNRIDITEEYNKMNGSEAKEGALQKLVNWATEHPGLAAGGGIALLKIGKSVIRNGGRILANHVETRNKDLRCWDASLGHYWNLRRKLTNDDWLVINKRKRRGESLGEILRALNALK